MHSQVQLVEAGVTARHLVDLVPIVQIVDSERTLVATLIQEVLISTGRHAVRARTSRVRLGTSSRLV